MSVQTSSRPILIIRYKRKKEGFSPYLIFSMLIHGGLALLVSATLLVNLQVPQEPYTQIRLVEEIPPPEPPLKKTPKARPKMEKKAALPQEVRPRSKPSRRGPVQPPAAPKVASRQEPVPPAPKEVPQPPVRESAPAAPAQPKSWGLAQPPSPSPSPSSSSMQKLLSPEAAPGPGAKSSANLLAQLSERPRGEDLYQPAAPAGAESGPLPREVGGALGGKSKGRETGRGPASGIDRLAAGSGAGPAGQVASAAHDGGAGEKGTGFRAPSRPLSIGAPSRGVMGGLEGAAGGEKYIPLNSSDPDLGPYLAYLRERILRLWRTPEGGESLKGDVNLAFTVERDGSLSQARVVTSSGYRVLDKGVLEAVNRAAPFRPIPEEIKEKSLSVIGQFSYNK